MNQRSGCVHITCSFYSKLQSVLGAKPSHLNVVVTPVRLVKMKLGPQRVNWHPSAILIGYLWVAVSAGQFRSMICSYRSHLKCIMIGSTRKSDLGSPKDSIC